MLIAITLLAACTDEPQPKPATLLTLFDIQTQVQSGAAALAPGDISIRGRYTRQPMGISLDPTPAFAEGEPAAYVTTEYWFGFSKVWVQPLYIPAKRTPEGDFALASAQTLPIFSVGPESAFYSPYWQVFWVLVPPDITPDLRTSADVLNSGFELVPGPGRLCSLAPAPTGLTTNLHPHLQTQIVGVIGQAQGWVDGHDLPMSVVSFGDHRFTWDDNGVIHEDPLFVFRSLNTSGQRVMANLPSVGGIHPTAASVREVAPKNAPAFGSLWRIHFVDLPEGTKVLGPAATVPPNPRDEADVVDMRAAGIEVVRLPATQADAEAYRPYFYRVILKGSCSLETAFENALPSAPEASRCIYLDSHQRIEAFMPSYAIHPSPVSATCPYVSYRGKAVNPAPPPAGAMP